MDAAPRVLVADDQADIVVALQLLLRPVRLEVDPATSVQQVRERLAARPYDLVLMDLNYTRDTTSGVEGLDLLSEIRARDRLLPVIVMTGWGAIETAVEAMRRGARTFVTKPWDNAALTRTVLHEIEEGRSQRRADHLASTERADAQAIQRSLLPAAPAPVPGCDLAVRWEPAAVFGGDCYDVIRLSDTRVALAIGDVCGKGLPAALLMANLTASVRAFGAAGQAPADVVSRTNQALCRHQQLSRFVSLFYAIYDAGTRELRYANAGHNHPIVLRRDGSVARLGIGGMVAGVLPGANYEEGVTTLAPGDRLVLFTDGITEARSPDGEEYDDQRLVDAIRRHRQLDAAALADRLFAEAAAFAGGPLQDDATIVVASVAGGEG